MGGGSNQQQPEPTGRELVPADDGLSTSQESVPVPLWWGKWKIPARWISGVIDPKAIETNDAIGKK